MRKAALALWLLFLSGSTLHAQADFYKGKTIKIIVGFTPVGFYDRWARLLSRTMGKYIPGNPDIIVQNMAGAGSMVATNFFYSNAKPDGLTVVMPAYGIYLDQLVGRPEAAYDVRKFNWIGSPEKSDVILYVRADSPFKSLDDMRRAASPPKCGSTGTSGTDYILSRLLEETLGIKIATVSGYPGGAEIDIAVERGEVVCRGMSIVPHFGREPFDTWHKNGFDRHLVQSGVKRDPRAPDTPTMNEIFDKEKTSEESRRVADVILRGGDFGRPMIAPPGTPPERIKILREAYGKVLKDPELLAEAKKGRMDMDPVSGEELQELARKIIDQPPVVIERVKKILGN
jgi:tripartite-type tricarboxylate transporter receptor subunit TctC